MNSLENPNVERYLQDVANALRSADPERRDEILEQIADHIITATADLAPDDESGLSQVLERLGPPADIAQAADVSPYGMPSPDQGATPLATAPTKPSGSAEKWALAAFILSPILCLLSWLIGVVLLWTSQIWTTRHKVIGTVATLPLALTLVLGGLVGTITVRTSETVSVEPAVITESLSDGGDDSTVPTEETLPGSSISDDSTIVTTAVETQPRTLWRVLAIAAWALVLLIVPVATIVWLGRALVLYQRAASV